MFAACCTGKKKKQIKGISVHPKPVEKPMLKEGRRSDQMNSSVTVSKINPAEEEQKKGNGVINGNAGIVVEQ